VDDVSIFPDRSPNYQIDGIRDPIMSMAINLDLSLRVAIESGLTFRGDKSGIDVPEAIIVGHRVFEGSFEERG
jgi:hypothetical protein